jgi:lipid-binding SYLF domain-containing protein
VNISSKLFATIFISLLGFFILLPVQASAEDYDLQQELVDKARIAIDSFMADPDLDWFRKNAKNAKGLLIIPELLKGGFILGGSGGRGVLLLRDDESGEWSGPAFYMVGSVSIGLQIGGKISEVVMMVMTQRGVHSLYASSFKLGGDLSLAVGPKGVTAEGATAPSLNVDYISFARSKGAFAGISLDGAIVKKDDEWNSMYYGDTVQPADILVVRSVSNEGAEVLRQAVAKTVQEGITEGIPEQENVLEESRPLEQEDMQEKEIIVEEGTDELEEEDKENGIEQIRERYQQDQN